MTNCIVCRHAQSVSGLTFCHRRQNEGIVVKIDKDKLEIPCHARNHEHWNEYISSSGEFKRDEHDILEYYVNYIFGDESETLYGSR